MFTEQHSLARAALQLIANDAYAASFQTMRQYRSALIKELASACAQADAEPGSVDRAAFEAAYVAHMNCQEIASTWGQRDYTVDEIAANREGEFYNVGIAGVGQYSGYLNGCWWGWQNAPRSTQPGRPVGVALPEGWRIRVYDDDGFTWIALTKYGSDGNADDVSVLHAKVGNRNATVWHAFKDALATATTQQQEATHVEC